MKWMTTVLMAIIFSLLALQTTSSAKPKKILYIASYHVDKGEWSAGIKSGIDSVLNGRSDIVLKTHSMDTRLTKSEEKKKDAALKAKEIIDTWHPDVVITSDDNAAKYLLMPHFQNSKIPFVFCGLNWDATVYGLPYKNTAGMVEVQLIKEIIDHLSPYARGKRIGALRGDTLTNRKEQKHFEDQLGVSMQVRYVQNLSEWKVNYQELQHEVDMLVLGSLRALDTKNVPMDTIAQFILDTTKVPTGAYDEFMQSVAMVTLSTIPEEQGQWAAEQALNILGGVAPIDIPIVQNRKAKRILNMRIAKLLDITFPLDILESSHLVSGAKQKVLFVNSYHKGYRWSDDIEKGLMKALNLKTQWNSGVEDSGSNIDFKVFRMNTKLQNQDEQIKQAALEAKQLIDSWQPDVLVACDDNAVRFLIQPYYLGSSMPIVFCGINYDASVYDLPSENSTGMVEIEHLRDTITLLRDFAGGERIGYLGADDMSNSKSLTFQNKMLGIDYVEGSLVSTLEEWKKEYIRLQKTVDMLIILNPIGIQGWQPDQVDEFLLERTTIPSGAVGDSEVRYSLLGNVKIAEEQGWWAGKTALKILHGAVPSSIPVARNKESKLYINMAIANRLGIKFPLSLFERATIIEPNR
ncbi:ABC transporter substrate-binding protein [Desulfopila sp. IMCC35008]|uniref:ABC transporter substrate-binding protein n=1 Tax=Desulfopila sp. IMCC35008 TaxID=2653858 RepID=UPI0013D159FC|nr:ABC transporter substrate binding protein [Desulfopila sp. IMCC35008]